VANGSDQVEAFLSALVEELAIPEHRYQQAETSYGSLGSWFHREASTIRRYDPSVYSQGSFRLGTVIRPLHDGEEYDVDSVCELRGLGKLQLTQADLKAMVEVEIRSYHKSQNMTKPVREGRRCWVLDYADGAQFHMDIVPALPNTHAERVLLERRSVPVSVANTAIVITDNEEVDYKVITSNWPRSNPKGFAEWFRTRMAFALERRKRILAESLRQKGVTASVETLPDYRVRTPLQASIMLLKRHRDNMFVNDYENRPISIIITTLAAHSYGNQDTIAEALDVILRDMDKHIFQDGENYLIANPSDPFENFADKWKTKPKRKDAFYNWLHQARRDFGAAARASSLEGMNEAVKMRMGVGLAQKAVTRASGANRLLRAATVAPAASMPSYANAARVPSKPKGFA
jgi:hypothetical protein